MLRWCAGASTSSAAETARSTRASPTTSASASEHTCAAAAPATRAPAAPDACAPRNGAEQGGGALTLVHEEPARSKSAALRREHQLKRMPRREKLAFLDSLRRRG